MAPAALSQGASTPFSYTYIDLAYLKSDVSSQLPRLDGYRTSLSYGNADGSRLLLNFETTEETALGQENKREDLELGVGFFSPYNASMDIILDLKYLRGERTGFKKSDGAKSGYGVEFGLRGLLMESLEIDASAEYREYHQAEFGGRLGLQWQMSKTISLVGLYSYFKTEEKAYFGMRYSF